MAMSIVPALAAGVIMGLLMRAIVIATAAMRMGLSVVCAIHRSQGQTQHHRQTYT